MKSFFAWTSSNTETYYCSTATQQHHYLTILKKILVVLKQKKHVLHFTQLHISSLAFPCTPWPC